MLFCMTIYRYRNGAGEERDIVGSMKDPPPEILVIFDDGTYMPPDELKFKDDNDPRLEEIKSKSNDERVFKRVYGNTHLMKPPNFVVEPNKDGLPVSVASPRRKGGEIVKRGKHTVREHKDGTHTTIHGQPIIDSNEAARRNAKRTGLELD